MKGDDTIMVRSTTNKTLYWMCCACVAWSVGLVATPAITEPAPACGLYTYKARIVRVIDGDTVVANIDLGFRTWLHDEHLRLFGIDAPERGTVAFETAKAALQIRIEGADVFVCTIKANRSDNEKTGSFGRYLVVIYHDGTNVNQSLVAQGLAEQYP